MQDFKFLFVESDDQINFLTKQIIQLDNIPIQAHIEKNPMEAFRYLEELNSGQFPDVIVISNSLSYMTGMEFIEEYLRSFYYFNPDTQIYMTASYCSPQTMSKIINTSQIAGFIAQPFSKKTFIERIVPNIHVSVV